MTSHFSALQKHREQAEALRKQREAELAKAKQERGKKKTLYLMIGAAVIVLILGGASYAVYSAKFKAGPYDTFAKCLTEKGAVMYGGMSWCQYTKQQAAMFGNSFRHIDYKDYTELEGIKKTPTWVINGEWYENVQSFDRLAQVSGCSLG